MAGDWSAAVIIRDMFSAPLARLQQGARAGATALTDMGQTGGRAADLLAGGLGKMAGGLAGAYALLRAGEAVADLTRIGAQAQTVGGIFANLTRTYGLSGDALLAGMEKASRGTMDQVAMMQTANRALLAGGADLANELPRLFEIARAAALASGDDINYVYETLIKGIIRGSPLLIDNAGIYIKVGSAVDDYAAKVGKASDELDSHEKMQATLNAVLSEGGAFMAQTGTDAETAADQVQGLGKQVRDLKAALGELALQKTQGGVGWLESLLGESASGARWLADPLKPLWDARQASIERFRQAEDEVTGAQGDLQTAMTSPLYALTRDASVAYYQEQLTAAEATRDRAGAEMDAALNAYAAATATETVTAATAEVAPAAVEATNALTDYAAALEELRAKNNVGTDLAKLTLGLEGAGRPEMPKLTGPLMSIDTGALNAYLDSIRELGPAEAEAANQAQMHANVLIQQQRNYISAQLALGDNRQALENLATATLGAGAGVLDLVDKFGQLPPEVQAAAIECGLLEEALDMLRAAAAAPITIDVRLDMLQSAQGDVDSMAMRLLNAGWSPEQVRAWRDQAQTDLESHWATIGEIDAFGLQLETETFLAGYETQVDAELDRDRQIEQARNEHLAEMKRLAAEQERAEAELRSSAESALMRGSQPTELDFLLTSTGQYEDAPLEAARRLDAIAQGGFDALKAHPDWGALLAIPPEVLAGSNDQLRAWAMQTSAAVTDLTRPDLIDWDAFVREFQEQEQAAAAKEGTIDLAVSKLSAAGVLGGDVGKIREQVNTMFGEADPAAGLISKLEGADMGGKLLTALQTDVTKNTEGYKTVGKNLGGLIATAVDEGVRLGVGTLRHTIATAVAPEVAAILQAGDPAGALP